MNSRRALSAAAVLIAALLLNVPASAQNSFPGGLGMYNSFKGFGLMYSIPSNNNVTDNFLLRCDNFGVISGRCSTPGILFQFSRGVTFRSYERDGVGYHLYAGAGVSAGYVKDFQKGYLSDPDKPLNHNMGAMIGVTGTFGCYFSFEGGIDLIAGWSATAGMHIRENENYGTLSMSGYLNGLLTALYPELTILYKFGR